MKIYIVKVMNRYDNDRITPHYFTTEEKAHRYADRLNAEYEAHREAKEYGKMVYHVNKDHGIVEAEADEE